MSSFEIDYTNLFVNPYNFVRLGGNVSRSALNYGDKTGVISCSLFLTSPMALPDSSTKKIDNNHSSMSFFQIDNKPVIPGSEIRGVIRSAYEALSNSCLSVNNNNILSARSLHIRKPGLIRFSEGKWHLYCVEQCRKLKADGSDDFNEDSCNFKRTWKSLKGKITTYQFKTSLKEIECVDLDKSIEDYEIINKIYIDNEKVNDEKVKLDTFCIHPKKDGKCYPVYYLPFDFEGKTFMYLSPAQISRSVFHNTVNDLLGSHKHCTDPNEVCDACKLFGMIGEKTKKDSISAIASRVRFTDGCIDGNYSFQNNVILSELSSPKISSVEFYSHAFDMNNLWNYDSKGIGLNGRKFYFHHNGNYTANEANKINITTQLLNKGAKFNFDVYFDHVTEEELRKLVWTLTIGENSQDGILQHKLGHGKPLGLGSVKITINQIKTRNFDKASLTYSENVCNIDEFFKENPFDANAEYYKDFIKIANINTVKEKNVSYPIASNGKDNIKNANASHQWFTANHDLGKIHIGDEPIKLYFTLPRLADKDLTLPAFKSCDKNNNSTPKEKTPKKNNSYNGPTEFKSKDQNKIQYEKVRCRKCKKEFNVQKSFGNIKQVKEVECPNCGNKFKSQPL